MRILFVIPHYKHQAYLIDSVASLLPQIDQRWDQILVINDEVGTNVDWVSLLDKENRIIVHDDGLHSGQTKRWNDGIKFAIEHDFEWIAFQAADDYALPNKVQTFDIHAFGKDVDVFYTDFLQQEVNSNVITYVRGQPFDLELLKQRNFIAASTTFMRVKFLDKVRFDEGLAYGEDWHMYNVMAKAGARFKYVPAPTVLYRNFTSNIGVRENPERWQRERERVRQKIAEVWK